MTALQRKERPIIFSGSSVRGILDDRKWATRRVMKHQPHEDASVTVENYNVAVVDRHGEQQPGPEVFGAWWSDGEHGCVCPYGQPGDRLWVRETHSIHATHGQRRTDGERWGPWGGLPTTISPDGTQIAYFREGFDRCDPGRWRPSIHMPRWASRILLEITDVRVERLQDISSDQARAEGYPSDRERETGGSDMDAWLWFRSHWEEINGSGSYSANPMVWVIEFQRIQP